MFVEMATISANSIALLPLLAPVNVKGLGKFTCSHPLRVSKQYMPFDGRRVQCKAGLGDSSLFADRRKPITHFTRMLSASIICFSSEQTQTVTQKSPTITHIPGKEKGPQLADGGGGFPPRDDGGGGGGGGGGENFSGGFFLFGILAFLGFLKELDKDSKRDRRN